MPRELVFRDIGPQVGYRTVFLVEYFGPILMMAICYLRPALLYGPNPKPISRQAECVGRRRPSLPAPAHTPGPPRHRARRIGVYCFIAHFVKRELETIFVHRFSRPTMPFFNIFKNSIYYWSFAFFVSYVLCHPDYTDADPLHFQIGLAIMGGALPAPTSAPPLPHLATAVCEVINFLVHLQFRMMRPKEGSLKRSPPKGILFSLVSCPNYTAEVLCWVGFSFATNVFICAPPPPAWHSRPRLTVHAPNPAPAYIFTLVGFAQMTEWALSKHRGYLRSYPEYKRFGRKAIIPFIL